MSFSNDAILDGAISPEGSLEDVTGVTIPTGTSLTSTSTPTKEETAEGLAPPEVATEEVAPTRKPLKGPTHPLVAVDNSTEGTDCSPGLTQRAKENGRLPIVATPAGQKCLHPLQLVTAVEPIPPVLGGSKGRHHNQSAGGRRAWHWRVKECLQTAELHPVWPPESAILVQEIAFPPGFTGVLAYLQRDPSPMAAIEAPHRDYATRDTGRTGNSYDVH